MSFKFLSLIFLTSCFYVKLNAMEVSLNETQSKRFELSNKLDVLLISNPKFTRSSVALSVDVGQYDDPKEHEGMAHFLEHMLFLGTEKYPDPGSFQNFLSSYSDEISNAYTSVENTNYYFSVLTKDFDIFKESLDRFSDFFKNPLFLEKFVNKEKMAVNSEFENASRKDEYRIISIVQSSFSKEDHPAKFFHTGNLKSLSQTDRSSVKNFYESQYSADRMHLTIMSPFSLKDLERNVEIFFSAIENKNLGQRFFDFSWDAEKIPGEVKIQAIRDEDRLMIFFPMDLERNPLNVNCLNKLERYLLSSSLGSLINNFKEKKWIINLDVGGTLQAGGFFAIDVLLTKKGLEEKSSLIGELFAYIRHLIKEGIPNEALEQFYKLDNLDYHYEEIISSQALAANFAQLMNDYKSSDLRKEKIFKVKNEDIIPFLRKLNPENMILTEACQAEKLQNPKKDEHTGALYEIGFLTQENLQLWNNSQLSFFPRWQVNPFIPDVENLEPAFSQKDPQKHQLDSYGYIWESSGSYAEKASFRLELNHHDQPLSPSQKARLVLLVKLLEDSLSDLRNMLVLGGMYLNLNTTPSGVSIELIGYQEHLMKAFDKVLNEISDLSLDPQRFLDIKENFAQQILNSKKSDPFRQGISWGREVLYDFGMTLGEIYDPEMGIDELTTLTIKDIEDYRNEFLKRLHVKGVAYGHFPYGVSKELVEKVLKKWKTEPGLEVDILPVTIPSGQKSIHLTNYGHESQAVVIFSDWGLGKDAKSHVISDALIDHINDNFYAKLRTDEQLGYIAHAAKFKDNSGFKMIYLIQSSDKSSQYLLDRIQAWKKDKSYLPSREEWKNLKEKKIAIYGRKSSDFYEAEEDFYYAAIHQKGEWNYKARLAEILDQITFEEMINFMEQLEERELVIHVTPFEKQKDFAKTVREEMAEGVRRN